MIPVGMVGLLAEGGTGTVTSALTDGLGTVATDALSSISAIVPVALPIMGAGIVITIAIKMFKKVSNKT